MSWLATDGLGGDYVIFTAHNSGRPKKKKIEITISLAKSLELNDEGKK